MLTHTDITQISHCVYDFIGHALIADFSVENTS